jgi:hypothetical protein
MLQRMELLIEMTLKQLPKTHIFLSDILGIGPKPCYGPDPDAVGNDMVHAFNAGLASLAEGYSAVTHVPLQNMTHIGENGMGLCPCEYHPTH